MSSVTCPFCNAVVPPEEVAEGWCENCGKRLPTFGFRSPGSVQDRQPVTRAEPTTKKPPSKAGTMVGAIIGALIFGILMTGPLRSTGYLITFAVGFGVFLVTMGIGQFAGRLFAKGLD